MFSLVSFLTAEGTPNALAPVLEHHERRGFPGRCSFILFPALTQCSVHSRLYLQDLVICSPSLSFCCFFPRIKMEKTHCGSLPALLDIMLSEHPLQHPTVVTRQALLWEGSHYLKAVIGGVPVRAKGAAVARQKTIPS